VSEPSFNGGHPSSIRLECVPGAAPSSRASTAVASAGPGLEHGPSATADATARREPAQLVVAVLTPLAAAAIAASVASVSIAKPAWG